MKLKTVIISNKIKYVAVAGLVLSTVSQVSAQQLTDTAKTGQPKGKKWDRGVNITWDKKPQSQITGSMATIWSKDILKNPVANLSNALTARLAGLITQQSSSEPGYDGANLNIRGISTFGNNQIKVFVDGVERDFSQLDPNEIESISVLKDASANAMYGISGANRTILVTTKRGNAGKPTINFTAQGGASTPMFMPKFLDSYNYATLYNEALQNDGLPVRYSAEALEAYKNNSNPWLYPNVDWQGELLKKNTYQQNYNFNIGGGSETARYFVSLGFYNQAGLYKHSDLNDNYSTNADFKRYNLRSNVDIDLSPRTLVQLDLSANIQTRNFPNASGSQIFNNISSYPPGLFPMLNQNGTIGGNAQYTRNPYGLLTSTGYVNDRSRYFQATARVEHRFAWLDGLSANLAFSFDNLYNQYLFQSKNFAVSALNQDGTYATFGANTQLGNRGQGLGQDNRVSVIGGLKFNHNFGSNNFNANLIYYQSSFKENLDPDQFAQQSIAARGSYTINGKYIAELALSYSGSENFAKGNRFGFFPVASAAWIVSKESFLNESKWVDYLKLRASYGLLGNALTGSFLGVGRFPYMQKYNGNVSGSYFGNQSFVGGVAEGVMANPNATWEKSKQLNFGIDADLFNQKLSVAIDLFNEKRTDILSSVNSASGMIGGLIPAQNIGKVSNRGVEWDITYKNNVNQLGYSIGFLGSLIKNKVDYMDEPFRENSYEYRRGQAVNQPFGLIADGFYKDQNDIDQSAVSSFSQVKPGDIKYKDLNNDNIIDNRDFTAIGNLPKFNYGIHLGLNYKGFDFSALIQGVADRSVFALNSTTIGFMDGAKPTDFVLNRWTPTTAATANYPRLSLNSINNYVNSTFWLRDAGFLRLKNVELGYNLNLGAKSTVKSIRFFTTGYNLFTISKFKDGDPESPVAGIGFYPLMKMINVGVKVGM